MTTLLIIAAIALFLLGAMQPMSSYGRTVQDTDALGLQVIADGDYSGFKAGGVTIDWSTVTAVSSDTTLPDGTVVKNGDKYLRYGQVIDLIAAAEAQTVTISGSPTGGTFTLTYGGQTTSALAYNASAAAVQAALEALSTINVGEVVVTLSGAVYTVTFNAVLGNVAQMTAAHAFTGGTSPDIAVATSSAGAGSGLYGPANTGASDGRQTLARGQSYILNETVLMSSLGSDHPPVFEAGTVYLPRIITNENNPGLSAPTEANVLAAFPELRVIRQD